MRETAQKKTMKDKFAGNDDAILLAKQQSRVHGQSMDQIRIVKRSEVTRLFKDF